MARMTFKSGAEYALRLSKLARCADGIAKRALYRGAKVVTDQIRKNIEALPEEEFRRLTKSDSFSGIPSNQKKDVLEGLGVTTMERDGDGLNVKVGFDGYGKNPTKKYPKGVPNQLIMRALESGTSWVRKKHPVVRNAVNATKPKAVEAMNQSINEDCEKIMKSKEG